MTLMIIGCPTLALVGLWLHTKETGDTPPGGGADHAAARLPISGLPTPHPTPPLGLRDSSSTLEREDANTGGLAGRSVRSSEKKVGTRGESSAPSSDVSSDVTQRRREITSHYGYRRLSAKRARRQGLDSSLSRSIFPFLIQGKKSLFFQVVFEHPNKKKKQNSSAHGVCLSASTFSRRGVKTKPPVLENEKLLSLGGDIGGGGEIREEKNKRRKRGNNLRQRDNCGCCLLERRRRFHQTRVLSGTRGPAAVSR